MRECCHGNKYRIEKKMKQELETGMERAGCSPGNDSKGEEVKCELKAGYSVDLLKGLINPLS